MELIFGQSIKAVETQATETGERPPAQLQPSNTGKSSSERGKLAITSRMKTHRGFVFSHAFEVGC